jgi:uncharacterized protein (TIGR00369 family)
MKIFTHIDASSTIVGVPLEITDGKAEVELKTTKEMVVDQYGLVHGGFTFGLADYASMLAVNHPHVVLGSADVKFTSPVRLGDSMKATAEILETRGKRRKVYVQVKVGERVVLEGSMLCFVLDKHILE